MADIKAQASTAWSLTSTWAGGVVPGPGDNAYANTFTVSLDVNPNCASMRNDAGGTVGAAAGGGFTNSVAGRSITANVIASTAAAITSSHTSGTLTITGNITAGPNSSATGLNLTGAGGATVINGNVAGPSSSSASGVLVSGVNHASITVNGTVTGGGSTATGAGVNLIATSCALTVTGACITLTGSSGNANAVTSASTGAHTFQGGVTCASTANWSIILSGAGHSCTLSGTVTAGLNNGNLFASSGANVTDTVTLTGQTLAGGAWSFTGSGSSTQSLSCAAITGSAGVNGLFTLGPGAGSTCTISTTGTITNLGNGININVNSAGGCVINCTSITGPTSSANPTVSVTGAGPLTVNGDTYGGPNSSNAYAVNVGNVATVYVQNGTAYGSSTGTGCPAIFVTSNITTGAVFVQKVQSNDYPNGAATSAAVGVSFNNNTGNNFVTVDELHTGSGGYHPVNGRSFFRAANASKVYQCRESNAGLIDNLGTGTTDYPAAANVRAGTSYDFGALTGTCAIPAAASVASGVAVDATVGTAALSPTALLGASLLTRLGNCATVQSTGDQLAALGP